VSMRFHRAVTTMVVEVCRSLRDEARAAGRGAGLDRVALGGGVFQNILLLAELRRSLAEAGFEVFVNRRVPPNDGGLALGQAAVAAGWLAGIPPPESAANEQEGS
jgi:hydrogenase maturation protein HypF